MTTVARTLLDLAGVLTRDRLLRVVETAVQLQTLNLIALDAAIARTPRRRGIRKLEAILDDYREPPDLRSRLERDFHALVRAANLPTPQTNVHVEGILVDCYWPHARLVVELDSRRFHTAAHAFEQDRIKGNVLGQLGYGLLRYTHKRVKRDRRNVIAELERMLRPLPA